MKLALERFDRVVGEIERAQIRLVLFLHLVETHPTENRSIRIGTIHDFHPLIARHVVSAIRLPSLRRALDVALPADVLALAQLGDGGVIAWLCETESVEISARQNA